MRGFDLLSRLVDSVAARLFRIQPVLLWLTCTYFAFMFIKNGVIKFDPEGFWGPPFAKWGFPVWFLYLVGFLETAGGVLIIVPFSKARFFGAITLATVMAGALITRLIHGLGIDDGFYIFFVVVCCLYIASLSKREEV